MKGKGRSIDANGRVVIPSEMRTALDLETGDSVFIQLEEKRIIIQKIVSQCKICGSEKNLDSQFGICQKCIEKIKKK